MTTKRILRNVPARLSVSLVDGDGGPAIADAVTVAGSRGNGSILFASRAAEASANVGEFTTDLSIADTAELDSFMLTWTADNGAEYVTFAEVVGGHYFTLDEARRAAPGLRDTDKYPNDLLIEVRNETEDECERLTKRAFVPRYRRVELDPRQGLWLPYVDVRKVRTLAIDGANVPVSVGPFGQLFPLTAEQVANAGPGYGRYATALSITADIEYGMEAPPADLKRAALVRFVSRLGLAKSGVPERNEYQIVEGQVFTTVTRDARGTLTGIREVDDVYHSYAMERDFQAVRIGGY